MLRIISWFEILRNIYFICWFNRAALFFQYFFGYLLINSHNMQAGLQGVCINLANSHIPRLPNFLLNLVIINFLPLALFLLARWDCPTYYSHHIFGTHFLQFPQGNCYLFGSTYMKAHFKENFEPCFLALHFYGQMALGHCYVKELAAEMLDSEASLVD